MSSQTSGIATAVEPIVFDMNHNFHILKFNFQLEAKLTEDPSTETFDLSFKYKKGEDVKTIFERKFHIDITETFGIPDIPASLKFELTSAAMKDGHPSVRVQISVIIHVLISHTFPIIDQILTTALMTKAQVAALRNSGEGAIPAPWLLEEDQVVMLSLPSPSFVTSSVNSANTGYVFTTS